MTRKHLLRTDEERRKLFSATRDAISKINSASDEQRLATALLKVVARYGFSHLLAGNIPLPNMPREAQKRNVILNHWPTDWVTRYFSCSYLDHDPAIIRVRSCESAFHWKEMMASTDIHSAGYRIMSEASEFGLKDGITIPFHPIDGGIIGFSLAGEKIEVPTEARSVLTMISSFVVARAIVLDETAKPQVNLTRREMDILKFIADGKTAWEISTIFSTAENTVNNQLSTMRTKFGVNKNTHMIAFAFRQGLIV